MFTVTTTNGLSVWEFHGGQVKKSEAQFEFTINKHDIMGLVRTAWDKSFGRVETNRKAIADRGWGPLNYCLLDHPELQETDDRVDNSLMAAGFLRPDHQELMPLEDLNTTHGFSGNLVSKFIEHKIQQQMENGDNPIEKRLNQKRGAQNKMERHAKISAGLWCRAEGHYISYRALVQGTR
jgi:hypothetical protein